MRGEAGEDVYGVFVKDYEPSPWVTTTEQGRAMSRDMVDAYVERLLEESRATSP